MYVSYWSRGQCGCTFKGDEEGVSLNEFLAGFHFMIVLFCRVLSRIGMLSRVERCYLAGLV